MFYDLLKSLLEVLLIAPVLAELLLQLFLIHCFRTQSNVNVVT